MPPLILIIDDSTTVRKIVEVALQREGYRVMSFPDGIAALRWLTSESSEIPALIFLDITLPKCDGYHIAQHLKGKPQLAQVPIVMLTRHSGIIDRLRARLCGACAFVTKPFTTQTLLACTQHYAGQPAQAQVPLGETFAISPCLDLSTSQHHGGPL